jgi:hypothetical protein
MALMAIEACMMSSSLSISLFAMSVYHLGGEGVNPPEIG